MKRDFTQNLPPRISQLLARGQGYARLNNICTLVYVTRDCLGRPCDELTAIFDHISAIPSKGYLIESRKVTGILEELETYTAFYLLDVADRVILDLRDGIASC